MPTNPLKGIGLNNKRSATVASVAEAAGVSRQTVSNVLNAPERVRPRTRERVEAAIRDLGYEPNRVARSLRTSASRMLGYCVWKYRAKPGDESDGEPIHGNTKLEITWTVIPTVIVLFGAIYSWIVLGDIESEASDRLPINVTAQQFEWTFNYPQENGKVVSSKTLVVPEDRQLDPVSYLAAGMAVFFLFFIVQYGVTGLLEERQQGTLPRLMAAPIPVAAIHVGKAMGATVIASAGGAEKIGLCKELGADVNAVDKNGETAMHGAAYKHLPKVVKSLGEAGANAGVWNQKNKAGHTPLEIAAGIQRGMNFVYSHETEAAIRELLDRAGAGR